jgi:hypothetical protein
MTSTGTDTRPRRRRIVQAILFGALCAAVVVFGVVAASAGTHRQNALTIGHTKHTPNPLCPQKPSEKYIQHHQGTPVKHGCAVIGSVTGFQIKADGHRHAFRVHQAGRIVAWAIDLAKTNGYENKAFGDTSFFGTKGLGGHPTARLAILKKKDGPHYKLLRQSETVDLKPDQGHKEFITLKHPLRVKKGLIVALTTQTWAPALASGTNVSKNNSWRASRHSGKCSGNNPDQTRALAIAAKPQTKIKSVRQYGCTYTDRLLYWAYYVPGLGHHH